MNKPEKRVPIVLRILNIREDRKRQGDHFKFISLCLIVFVVPALLVILISKFDPFLQIEPTAVNLPILMVLWWAFLYYMFSYYEKKHSFNLFLDKLVELDFVKLTAAIKEVRENEGKQDFEARDSDDLEYYAKQWRRKLTSRINSIW